MKKIILLAALVSGCSTVTSTRPFDCTTLIPEHWKEGVEGEAIPDFTEIDEIQKTDPKTAAVLETREWQKSFIGQSGRLSLANTRTSDSIEICRNANAQMMKSDEQSNRPWYQFWR